MMHKFWLNFKKKDLSIRFYIIAVLIFLIGLMFVKSENSDVFTILTYISMGLFEVGFIIWIYIVSKEYIRIKYVKFFWIFFHLAVIWLASVYASTIVSRGLGLPSSDFNYTVSLLTFFCYPPAFLLVATGLGLIAFFISIIIFSLIKIFEKQNFLESFSIFNIVGGAITLGFFAFGHDKIMSFYIASAEKYIPAISYQIDYQNIPLYMDQFPKIDKSVKIKLHANGVYSTLQKHENTYKLSVGKIE